MIRIGSGSGYWGDWPQAPKLMIESGPLDYLVMDYLAEVTISIMHKQKRRDPNAGFATDFVNDIGDLLPQIKDKGVKVLASAGGVNPRACALALLAKAEKLGVRGLKVGIVEGDDILGRLTGEIDGRPKLYRMSPDEPELGAIGGALASANVYLGAFPIVEALRQGADLVVTGRCTDPSLTLGPIIHEFGVGEADWDALAFGTVVGHILECGSQASGGNFMGDWRAVPDADRIGFPIAEVYGKDRAVITKHANLGGLVSMAVVKEQLVYEIGDPEQYLTPDVTADFTTIQLKDIGKDKVEVTGVKGSPPPPKLKVSCTYDGGFMVTGQITYCWPEAREKALAAGALIRKRAENKFGKEAFDQWSIEAIGAGACHGALAGQGIDPPEVVLRIAAHSWNKDACDGLGRELAPMVLTGPPGATGFAGGRPRASSVLAYWSGLIDREQVKPHVEVLGG
jgi:hypothetical protein